MTHPKAQRAHGWTNSAFSPAPPAALCGKISRPSYQRISTGYCRICGSQEIIANPSCLACATNMRSNGSRCNHGKRRYAERCSGFISKNFYPNSGRLVKNSSGTCSFLTVTLVESSHNVAWLTKARLWSLSSQALTRLESRGESEQAQSKVWRSNSAASLPSIFDAECARFFIIPQVEIRRHTDATLECTYPPIHPGFRNIRHQWNHRFCGTANHHGLSRRSDLFDQRGKLRFTFSSRPSLHAQGKSDQTRFVEISLLFASNSSTANHNISFHTMETLPW